MTISIFGPSESSTCRIYLGSISLDLVVDYRKLLKNTSKLLQCIFCMRLWLRRAIFDTTEVYLIKYIYTFDCVPLGDFKNQFDIFQKLQKLKKPQQVSTRKNVCHLSTNILYLSSKYPFLWSSQSFKKFPERLKKYWQNIYILYDKLFPFNGQPLRSLFLFY